MSDTDGGYKTELARLSVDGKVALADLLHAHTPRLKKMIAFRLDRQLVARVDPDDILQDAYLEAACRLHEYLAEPNVPLIVWFRFLVSQRIAEVHRWHSRKKRTVRREVRGVTGNVKRQESSLFHQLAGPDTTPSLVASRHELQATLHLLVADLGQRDREILCLRHFEELTNQEAATELAITPAAASKRYIRALKRLRESASKREINLDRLR